MNERYSRNRLYVTEDEQQQIKNTKILFYSDPDTCSFDVFSLYYFQIGTAVGGGDRYFRFDVKGGGLSFGDILYSDQFREQRRGGGGQFFDNEGYQ